jgi:hypothetical protein
VLDANVLLNIYRYSTETAKQFLETFEQLGERIWIPYQAAKEFQDNRLKVITGERSVYSEFQKKILAIEGELNNRNRNPFLSDKVFTQLKKSLRKAIKELQNKEKSYSSLLSQDTTLSEISKILSGKVGENFSIDRLKEIYKDGNERYRLKIPPGYKDINKGGNHQFGDLILWYQIIKKAQDMELDVIFITDDDKEDWWRVHNTQKYGPRPELRKEFFEETGKECYFYSPYQFIKNVEKYLDKSVEKDVINEVKELMPANYENTAIETSPDSLILIEMLVEFKSESVVIDDFMNSVRDKGYQISSELVASDKIKFNVYIPNIPDLIRRYRNFSLPLLKHFGLILLKFEIKTVYF